MPAVTVWTVERDRAILAGRAAGVSWDAIAKDLGLSRFTVIERGRRLGVAKIAQLGSAAERMTLSAPMAEPQPRSFAERPPLPAGSSLSWSALLTLTPSLAGMAYPRGELG